MRLTGRSIKRRLYGLATLPTRVARARYFRGHGVHSPFVYAIVRQVFMKNRLAGDETALQDALLRLDVAPRRAMQLQNLCTHCGYETFSIDALDTPCDLCLLTPRLAPAATRELVRRAALQGTTVALLAPCDGRERTDLCREFVERHGCTSVDNRGYLLLFSDDDLPKQHYRL